MSELCQCGKNAHWFEQKWLSGMDSNHVKELQRLLCYHYTTGQHSPKLAPTRCRRKGKTSRADLARSGGSNSHYGHVTPRRVRAPNATKIWGLVWRAGGIWVGSDRSMPSFPLTPALSPGGRENLRQRVRKPSVSGMLGRRSARSPLPKGDGWGEGEGRNRPAIPREDELCPPPRQPSKS